MSLLKPIFHWKLDLRWLPNANEIDTKKKKCMWPTQTFAFETQRNLYSADSRLDFVLGVTQILKFTLGVMQILAFLDTNMLVSP